MNSQTVCSRPVRATVFSFLGLLGVVALFALAKGKGIIEPAVARRAIGLLVGAMIVIVGNLVPKLRPLNSPSSDPAEAGAAERSAGWTLVLAGIVYIALFAFAIRRGRAFLIIYRDRRDSSDRRELDVARTRHAVPQYEVS